MAQDIGQSGPAAAPQALTGSHGPAAGAGQSLMIEVAKKIKVSPFRQFAEMARLRGGQCGISALEYYEFELYRPDLSMDEKREFVGEKGSHKLNVRLAPPNLTHMRNFLADKLMLTTVMAGMGLATTRVQAAFSPSRGFGTYPTLRSAAEVEHFLRYDARFPLFGKPIRGSQAKGSALMLGVEGDAVTLGNGQRTPLAKIAAEIAENVTYGYVFQDAVTPAPEIANLTGSRTVSTLRVVTVNRTDRPEVLYTTWKLPAPDAMSDNFWQKGSLIALINPATGVVEKVRQGEDLQTRWVETHPVTGAQLLGVTLPHFQAVLDLARAAHAVVPDNGILGWDIALVPGGACLIECNENTGHALYQLASGRGVLNADFLPVFDAVSARNTRILKAFAARMKTYYKAKSGF
jgi:hypothetical protein